LKQRKEYAMGTMRGSETEKNLITSFAGESQARNRYSYFASKARNEGLVQIGMIFEETANHQKEHAKRFFKLLEGGDVLVQMPFPAGIIGGTVENLRAAASGEHREWTELYPGFAEVAKAEGFNAAASIWEAISVSEKQHEKRYLGLLANMEAGKAFKKDIAVVWRCINCGYLHEGLAAPEEFPACAHPQGYYELLSENW
jgi:rubrerythrin